MKLKLLLAAVAAMLLLTACPPTPRPPGEAQLRALHGVAGGANVDVFIDSDQVLADVAYKEASGYLPVTAGERDVTVTVAGDPDEVVFEATVDVAPNKRFTVIVLGQPEEDAEFPVEALVLDDTTDAPEAGNIKVRVVHGVPGAPNVDVYVTAPAAQLADPVLEDVAYKGFNEDFLEIAGGDYRIRLTAAGATDVIYDSATVTLAEGGIYTIVALPETDPEAQSPITLVVLQTGELPPFTELPDQTPPPDPSFGLALTVTAGLQADTCATATSLFIKQGQGVYFCYTVTNTGDATIPLHALNDSLSGVILRDFDFNLVPGAQVSVVSETAVPVSATTVNRATWDGFVGDRRVATAEASITVTVVPDTGPAPFEYAAVAGTFVGNSNSPTIGAFDGNLLLIGVRNFDGSPVTQQVGVTITVPGIGAFDYVFNPAETDDGFIALLIRDFEAGPLALAQNAMARALSQALSIPVEVVTIERPAFSPQAAVGGEFVFAFPGQTITRTVDVDAKLTVPEVTSVTLNDDRDELTVSFTESANGVTYLLTAFGRGPNAHVGATEASGSPATVALSGALDVDELYVVEVTAVRGEIDDLFDVPQQLDVGQYVYYSE